MQKTLLAAPIFSLAPHVPPLPPWVKAALVANDRIRSISWSACHLPRGPTHRA